MAITYAQLEAIRFLAICFGAGAGGYLLWGMWVAVRKP